ncbi:30S ribosomal protein S8 [Candidatus Portiera aleyrodidarum]|uniref:Small ribosomal subunit protein uS8 n=1 Tax=Candidatus Portiera aleyrodidarum MED (Bemisia tabaci) TaxID=1163752 RepID=A0AAU8RPT8_9GAMM|nr:30S ribosomal protein S8 [Candidatus Portiera aleyrodidarum]AFQ24059.1 ribosomal protein S8 [Candidatus Portiera aleyrodidarum BT-B-HRs]AFS18823.1 30S ribosomal protein S8 [Candidatus Portiera aleyrodidarum BT-QVLC]AFT80449.1 SSU ribosomal protein S8p (S15Ae) [Candidatus Portiera aleyrodidarum BT-QVLC]AFT80730.1 SSU ribosomal protein S8p (S15Ae) [Candidatus Portiera aleyrodidarum BT-B-HRs]AJF24036.1 30S ribosomal protein S8 [Candidatus Portiera aleyrodidarum MED (Bemisia tabaci)]
MSMQDTIADMLTRLRNAQLVCKSEVVIPISKLKLEISRILKEEGYILYYANDKTNITVKLKYFKGQPVISNIKRISKPSLRIYKGKDQLVKIDDGLGIVIVSTSKGLMTSSEAIKRALGGEVICIVH